MEQQVSGTLVHLEEAFRALPASIAVADDARGRARRWSEAVETAYPGVPESAAALCFAVEMLLALPPGAGTDRAALQELVDRVEQVIPIPRSVLGRLVLANPTEPDAQDQTVSRALALLLAATRARSISVWTASPAGGDLSTVGEAGDPPAAETAAAVASALLAKGGPAEHVDGDTLGIRLIDRGARGSDGRTAGGPAALVACGATVSGTELRLLFDAARPTLVAAITPSPDAREAARAATATQRQLTRLRFDLHDGPQQDVLLLAEDLRLFQSQLESVLTNHPLRSRLVGRLDDLKARLVALDGDLRRISSLLLSPFLQTQAFPEAVGELAEAFTQRTAITPALQLAGDFGELSESQQITLLQLIREALNNIREHSDADAVSITVRAHGHGVEATVTDNGRGFDPESALIEAARAGHLGLVGMHERVHMLGGLTQIDSRPGGPTVISVSLPARPAGEPDFE
jgi:signal transduction histidine kinase